MHGWHNAGLWREWNVLFWLDSFFPFHLDSFFLTGRPCFLLCSSVLCQHQPWASHRENALMCPHCAAAPLCPDWWIAGGAAGQCGSGWGMKASGAARGHLHTEPCLCVCFIFNCFPWPQAELPCQRPSHGRYDLPLPLSQFISFLSPSISSSFLSLPFVCPSINVLWESSRWQVNICVWSVKQNMNQMKFLL